MWSKILLCCLVGVAFASNAGWKDNTEYVYQIRGRTLSSLHDVAQEYSGMLMKAKLVVQPRSEGELYARIIDAQYGQIHAHLSEGWNTPIADSQITYKQLPITEKPFKLVMEQGVIRDLIVDESVAEWEANIIKSIVSQMQLDTKAQNLVESRMNSLPTEDSNTAVFKTLEDTVTGISETLYEIHPMPEYVLQSKPWLAPFPHLKGDGQILEIVKSKNFSRHEELPSYYFGLSGIKHDEPSTNKVGDFLTRTSMGHAIITGNLNRYTIQHSMTVNKIIVSPTMNNQQKGSVTSLLNITLEIAQPIERQFEELSRPVSLGNLVYRFSKQSTSDNKVRPGKQFRLEEFTTESNEVNSNEQRLNSIGAGRFRRSLKQQVDSVSSEEFWQQDEPKMDKAPLSPFLPFTMGYQGRPVKYSEQVKIIEAVQKLAQQIGQDLEQPEDMEKKNTLARFVLMSSLVRTMDEQELRQASAGLYTKEEAKRFAWIVFRDSVAQSGTGPAFLTIREWIETKKIQHHEAAEVFETLTHCVRQPTEEYIRAVYALISKDVVLKQRVLNETALLSFSDLIRRVYVDIRASHTEYPVHSFGKFATKEGQAFLREEYIPFLAKNLRAAIHEADSHRIHVYIRALGNVAHREILAIFKPYLEGDKQCSQFQRMLMVVAMDKLVKVEPKVARSVLYKIYQNAGELQEIRTAAVYQLMRTSPPTDMLQRMAEYTHEDASEYVNAAVKSSIENFAQLQGKEFNQIRSSAQAAQPLLTKKFYGIQFPVNHLRDYVEREMNVYYKQTVQSIVSEESLIPSGLKYALRSKVGGFERQLVNVQGMLSSIDELVNVLEQQTEFYHKQQERKQTESHQWSSSKIADLLNMKPEQREQLEGNLYLHMGSLHRLWSFDNQSIELIPEVLRELEETLKSGKNFHYTKLSNHGEYAMAFPTETGLPFMYTFDTPLVVKIEGKINAEAQPQITSGKRIALPEELKATTELNAVVYAKTQTKIGFVTPFDHQEYAAGYDKSIQINVPLRSKININLKNMEVIAEVEALEPKKSTPVLRFGSWPYTTKYDILSLRPVAEQPSTQLIKEKSEHKIDQVFGQQSGVAFRVQYNGHKSFINFAQWAQKMHSENLMTSFWTPLLEETIQHRDVLIRFEGQESSTRGLKIRFSGKHSFENQYEEERKTNVEDLLKINHESRMEELTRRASAGIRQAQTFAYNAKIELIGEKKMEIFATAVVAKSNVDPKSNTIFTLVKKSANPFYAAFVAKTMSRNTNKINLESAMKMDSPIESEITLAYGRQTSALTKLEGQVKLHKSEDRKQYLRQSPLYKQCQREMEQGNYQLSACARMSQMANTMDRVNIQFRYENLHHETSQMAHELLNGLRFWTRLNLKEQIHSTGHGGKQNQIEFEAKFTPDFETVDFICADHDKKIEFNNLRVNDFAKRFVSVRSTHGVQEPLSANAFCTVDKNEVNTFDNRSYSLELKNKWTVMLQYRPRRAHSHHKQQEQTTEQIMKQQLEHYVVLVREATAGHKEVKIVVQTPRTEQKNIDITFKTEGQTRVYVNDKEIEFTEEKMHQLFNGYVQVFALPNGEVEAQIKNAFTVVFDGKRVKLVNVSNKFRSAVHGLCGSFTNEKHTDFVTPTNCMVRDARDFIASYTIESGRQNQENKHCVHKKTPMYVQVISERDVKSNERRTRTQKGCETKQTRYVMENGQVCFTVQPVDVCRPECRQSGKTIKNVEVHCVQDSNVAALWKTQINRGASPDFSHKSVTRTAGVEVPDQCHN